MEEQHQSYHILEIIRGTTVDGPGFRTSIYFAGCNHRCEGCHNPHSHDPQGGKLMSLEEIMQIVEEEDFDVTLSGGDPLYDPLKARKLVKALKAHNRNVWIYTGYTWEEITSSTEFLKAIEDADVVVDGRFEMSLRNTDLRFRGSSNQRIIDIRASLMQEMPVIWKD